MTEPVAIRDLLATLAESVQTKSTTPPNSCSDTDSPGESGECVVCGGPGMYLPDVAPGDPRYTQVLYCDCAAGRVLQEAILRRYQDGVIPSARALAGMTPAYRNRYEQLRYEVMVSAAALPFDMQAYTFDTFVALGDLSQRQTAACETARELAAFGTVLSRNMQRPGLYLWSEEPGLGKTGLAAAIVNRRLQMGMPCLFASTPALFDHIRATFRPDADRSYDEMVETVKAAPLLVLDDLDKVNSSEFVARVFYDIVNHRYLHCTGEDHLITVFTANVSLDGLADYMNAATIDRIRAMSAVVEVAGQNLRR